MVEHKMCYFLYWSAHFMVHKSWSHNTGKERLLDTCGWFFYGQFFLSHFFMASRRIYRVFKSVSVQYFFVSFSAKSIYNPTKLKNFCYLNRTSCNNFFSDLEESHTNVEHLRSPKTEQQQGSMEACINDKFGSRAALIDKSMAA